MALLAEFKNSWDMSHTAVQQEICADFADYLLKAAQLAAVKLGTGQFGFAGAHGMKMETRFFATGSHRFYRASVGYSIEKSVYEFLVAAYMAQAKENNIYTATSQRGHPFAFAFEFTGTCDGFPNSFKNSRPDIRVALGKGQDGNWYEALFDLTSEKQKGHVLKKRDKWVTKERVPYIAEILWTDDDIMLKTV